MALHRLKLCVGADSMVDPIANPWDLASVQIVIDEAGGRFSSWQGNPTYTDGDGIGRCHLVLEPVVVPLEPRPCRPFQGWRYLTDKDAPRDIDGRSGDLGAMPEALRRELAELGLL